MKNIAIFFFCLLASFLLAWPGFAPAQAPVRTEQARPNIVLMFPDNLGVGEVGCYGGARGVATPNIDRIAAEGMRFTNFNVEYSCVVSRIALLTGRLAVRTGEGYAAGMTLWEVTIAEALETLGYSTALFGKWHVGGSDWEGRREPTQQGFEEWWGIPGTSHTAQFTSFENFDPARADGPQPAGQEGALCEFVVDRADTVARQRIPVIGAVDRERIEFAVAVDIS